MNRLLRYAVLTSLALAASEQFYDPCKPKPEKWKAEPKPKGNLYHFVYGELVGYEYASISEFSCYALNEKSAKRKYKKFKNNCK